MALERTVFVLLTHDNRFVDVFGFRQVAERVAELEDRGLVIEECEVELPEEG